MLSGSLVWKAAAWLSDRGACRLQDDWGNLDCKYKFIGDIIIKQAVIKNIRKVIKEDIYGIYQAEYPPYWKMNL